MSGADNKPGYPPMPFGQGHAQVFDNIREFTDRISTAVDSQFYFDAIGDSRQFRHAASAVEINGTHLVASVSTPTRFRVGESEQFYLMVPFHGSASARVKGHEPAFENVRDVFFSPNIPRSGESSTLAMMQAMLDGERIKATARTMLGDLAAHQIEPYLGQPNVLAFQQGCIRYDHIFKRLCQTMDDLQCNESLLAMHGVDDSLYRTLVMMLLPEFCLPDRNESLPSRHAQIDQVCDYILANLAYPIRLTQLEEVSGMTSRSLRYGFQKRFGLSPMQWMQQQRLELAYQQLSMAKPADTVTSVAYACGFTRLGAFARDFFRRFGERPSDTLARASIRL